MSDQAIEQYESLTPSAHVLLRKETYAGDCVTKTSERAMCDRGAMATTSCTTNDGLQKLFDEALDNSVDNAFRDPPTRTVRVRMCDTTFECMNDGAHIPVKKKPDGAYVASSIFFKMFSGSNFNDEMNGVGITLAAILSTRFQVDTVDPIALLHLTQRCVDNMRTIHPPEVRRVRKRDLKKGAMTTVVKFTPDLSRFRGIRDLLPMQALVRTRMVQLSCTLGGRVRFVFNNEEIKAKSFKQYIGLYSFEKSMFAALSDRFEYGFALSGGGEFRHDSFVNNVATIEGGTHVATVTSQIVAIICDYFSRKFSKSAAKLSRNAVKNKLHVFVNARIVNPEFRSQSKSYLTSCLRKGDFAISPKRVLSVAKSSGMLDALEEMLNSKEMDALSATNGKKRRLVQIENLSDAQWAGTARSNMCSLFVVEGLSAKTFAVSGLAEVGNKSYGVMPLKGKPLNCYSGSLAAVSKNKEITNLMKCLGLTIGRRYDTEDALSSLRYRHIVLLCDADVDGMHITWLIVAWLQRFFPTLLQNGFVKRFISPMIVASKGRSKLEFFSLSEFNAWADAALGTDAARGWAIKYFKGLGTSTQQQARAYFRDLPRYLKTVSVDDETPEWVSLLFGSSRADDRKAWMARDPPPPLDYTDPDMSATRGMEVEMRDFSHESLTRAIPGIDGFKEAQRKVLYAAIKKCGAKNDEVKIAQLGSYAAEVTCYLHGEVSIQNTASKMTTSYIGSNLLPVLEACGQTGSRLHLGADAASTRYTYTRLMPYTRMIYDERDEAILERRQEEGHPIEWATYVPIIPMILVNGCNGIATGYRSQIPCHDPCALIDNLLRKMSGGEFRPFDPWYGTGWTGTVLSGTDWAYRGVYEQRGNRVVVTDLPIGVATEKYKSGILSRLLESKHVLSVVEAHPSENLVRFELVVAQSFDASMLKLESKMSKQCLNLMVNGRITHFASTLSILERYYVWRLALYGRRKESMLSVWDARLLELTFKQRFILGVLSGRIVLKRAKKADVVASAIALGIPAALCDKFCALSLLSLTRERVAELEAEVGRIRGDIAALAGTSPTALWETDLRALKPVVRKWLASAERVPKRPKAGGKGERSNNKKKMRTV